MDGLIGQQWLQKGLSRESLLRLSLSTRDLGSRIGVVLVSRTLKLYHFVMSVVSTNHGGADHARFCDSIGLNACTVESLVDGDHRNENTWLETASGRLLSLGPSV